MFCNKNRTLKNVEKTLGGGFNPFARNYIVKSDHFPSVGVQIETYLKPPPWKMTETKISKLTSRSCHDALTRKEVLVATFRHRNVYKGFSVWYEAISFSTKWEKDLYDFGMTGVLQMTWNDVMKCEKNTAMNWKAFKGNASSVHPWKWFQNGCTTDTIVWLPSKINFRNKHQGVQCWHCQQKGLALLPKCHHTVVTYILNICPPTSAMNSMPVNLGELAKTLHQATLRQILEMLLRGQMPREIPRRRTEAAVGIDLQGKNLVNNILRWWKKT